MYICYYLCTLMPSLFVSILHVQLLLSLVLHQIHIHTSGCSSTRCYACSFEKMAPKKTLTQLFKAYKSNTCMFRVNTHLTYDYEYVCTTKLSIVYDPDDITDEGVLLLKYVSDRALPPALKRVIVLILH